MFLKYVPNRGLITTKVFARTPYWGCTLAAINEAWAHVFLLHLFNHLKKKKKEEKDIFSKLYNHINHKVSETSPE